MCFGPSLSTVRPIFKSCITMGLGDLANTVTSPIRATGRLVFGDKKLKVGVVGAAGGIGQPLALLLKLSPFVTELSLFDVAPFTPGKCFLLVYPTVMRCAVRCKSIWGALWIATQCRRRPSPQRVRWLHETYAAAIIVYTFCMAISCPVLLSSLGRRVVVCSSWTT